MKLCVTGGHGRLGAPLVDALRNAGHTVHAPTSAECDLLYPGDAEVAVAGAEAVIHLAKPSRRPARLVQGAPADLALLLDDQLAAAASLAKVARVVHCRGAGETDAVLRAAGLAVVPSAPTVEALLDAAVNGLASEAPVAADDAFSGARPTLSSVCSVQRLPLPSDWTAEDAVRAYFRWLPSKVPLVGVAQHHLSFEIFMAGKLLLRLSARPGRVSPHSVALDVGGPFAADAPRACFEFRVVTSREALITALTGFEPALPWLLYRMTEAPLHAAVMAAFGRAHTRAV